jgi:hypothetical protein
MAEVLITQPQLEYTQGYVFFITFLHLLNMKQESYLLGCDFGEYAVQIMLQLINGIVNGHFWPKIHTRIYITARSALKYCTGGWIYTKGNKRK